MEASSANAVNVARLPAQTRMYEYSIPAGPPLDERVSDSYEIKARTINQLFKFEPKLSVKVSVASRQRGRLSHRKDPDHVLRTRRLKLRIDMKPKLRFMTGLFPVRRR